MTNTTTQKTHHGSGIVTDIEKTKQTFQQTTLPTERRQKCEVWTRVMGYHRPKSQFNKGKQSEFSERVYFQVEDRTS